MTNIKLALFTSGQIKFAIFFVIIFVVAMIYAYRKDIQLHRQFYKGNYKILIGFILFIIMLFVIKKFLKH